MSSPTLPAHVLEGLTPAQVRVWCALVMRHQVLALGVGTEDHRRLVGRMSQREIAASASVTMDTWARAMRVLVNYGVVEAVPRFVPPGWDGDPQHVVGVQDAWHTIRIANDYRLHPCARMLRTIS